MTTKTTRKIVHIDEAKCDGCGNCSIACAEGALRIIDGKARLISETYCDGLGACLGECPQDAITIEERLAEDFSEAAVANHMRQDKVVHACPGSAILGFTEPPSPEKTVRRQSALSNWPVQLALVPPQAPFLRNADIMVTAQCVPFSYADFHADFLAGHVLLIACPKLDDFEAHLQKLTEILAVAKPKSLTVVHMEVPCCSGLAFMVRQAIQANGMKTTIREVTIGVKGEVKTQG